MPVITDSEYSKRPFYMRNGHMETIFPSLFFRVPDPGYFRTRLELPDGDFVDLDRLTKSGNQHLMIISHGLEGSAHRHYVRRTATYFHELGWDVLAWNCRSCSGEMNRLPKFYHHGATEDLAAVVDHAVDQGTYKKVVLMGYSMGGSMSLKYMGEQRSVTDKIKAVVAYSVPCNLKDSAEQLKLKSNRFYEKRFVKKLTEKVRLKAADHSTIDVEALEGIQDFDAFHALFTVPIYGFSTMEDFYHSATCDRYFPDLKVPSLVCNAKNDPLLGEKCYPWEAASKLDQLILETPSVGGHVGFTQSGMSITYMEDRTRTFLNSLGLTPSESM